MKGIEAASYVSEALSDGRPLVALESALITHGLPRPDNLRVARRMEALVREEGAVPATVAVIDGVARVGLEPEALERLAQETTAIKVSVRDLPSALAQGRTGGTTVAGTVTLAHRAGIRVFATGGIGGVHRGHPEDVSADLMALASNPLIVVCAGAKAILDLPRTLEALETWGVPVVGYRTDTFPAFTSRSSGLPVPIRADSPEEVARMMRAQETLGLASAILVGVPIPAEAELPWQEAEAEIEGAILEAAERGIVGKDLTPFLLARLSERTAGRSRAANEALLFHNARMAARIAQAYASSGAG